MRDDITIETDLFEHREVKPHFINSCCFGEDFAAWLRGRLSPLAAELTRRVKAKSARHAVVVRFSKSRRRYERQGLLVEPQALTEAQRELALQTAGQGWALRSPASSHG